MRNCDQNYQADTAEHLPSAPLLQTFLILLSFAWPWQALQIFPQAGIYLDQVLAACIILFTIRLLLQERIYQGSFDLLWPGALLIGLSFFIPHSNSIYMVMSMMLFLVILHMMPSRTVIIHCLWVSLTASAGAALFTLYGWRFALFPTDFLYSSGLTTHFAYTIQDALWIHAIFSMLGFGLSLSAALQKQVYISLTALLFTSLNGIVIVFCVPHLEITLFHAMPRIPDLTLMALLACGLGLYLTARVAAKLILSRRMDFKGEQYVLSGVLIVGALFTLLLGRYPGLEAGLIAGLAATYAWPGPHRINIGHSVLSIRSSVLPLAVLPLVFINHMAVFEYNTSDVRNYVSWYRNTVARGQDEEARKRLEFLHQHFPQERTVSLLLARHVMRDGAYEAASHYLSQAAHPTASSMISPPDSHDLDAALVRLRDALFALPPESRGLAYERALTGLGLENEAWAALRLRAEMHRTPPPTDNDDIKAIQSALKNLLGTSPESIPMDWSNELWVTAYRTAGGKILTIPELPIAGSAILVWRQLSDTHELLWYDDTGALLACSNAALADTESGIGISSAPELDYVYDAKSNTMKIQLVSPDNGILGVLSVNTTENVEITMNDAHQAHGQLEWLQCMWLLQGENNRIESLYQ